MQSAVFLVFFASLVLVDAKIDINYRLDGLREIKRALGVSKNTNLAKNVIIMIGDGMGLPSVAAGRIYKGQKLGFPGEEYKLSFETFPNTGLSKTYNIDRQVGDSAGTGSQMMAGEKVNYGTIGVSKDVPYAPSCAGYSKNFNLKTILDYASEAKKSVGFVTTARVTHATPASTYAHVPFRDWESDSDMAGIEGCEDVDDIAKQLILDNPNIQVILGGGRRSFLNNTTPDPATGRIHKQHRTDGQDLIQAWLDDKQRRLYRPGHRNSDKNRRHAYVENRGQLMNIDTRKTDFLLGLFSSSHMTYELERDKSETGEPSLREMATTAIDILKKNPNGYFLLIEGGRIDHAHHNNSAKKALEEVASFDDTVIAVGSRVSEKDTLQIVTADHSHVFFLAGYASRGRNILGTVDIIDPGEGPTDGMPYLTLGYGNGDEYGRKDLTNVDTTANDFRQPGCVPMETEAETHGGEDVVIYAKGPYAHLFHTTHEQSYIGHVMMYASCTGFYADDCHHPKNFWHK